jgi:hypothetical protein
VHGLGLRVQASGVGRACKRGGVEHKGGGRGVGSGFRVSCREGLEFRAQGSRLRGYSLGFRV